MYIANSHGNARKLALAATTMVIACFGSMALLEVLEPSWSLRLILALVPLAAFALLIFTEIAALRSLDEMERQTQLEALAIAYPTTILLVFGAGFLERAGLALPGFQRARDLWPLAVLPYFAGLWLARRRYR